MLGFQKWESAKLLERFLQRCDYWHRFPRKEAHGRTPSSAVVRDHRGHAPAIDQGAGMPSSDNGHCICLGTHVENLYGAECEIGELEVRCWAVPENAAGILD